MKRDSFSQTLAQRYFLKKPHVMYFAHGQTLIATVPLVMSSSLGTTQRPVAEGFDERDFDRTVCLIRPERDRLLSAYNKKVLASKYDLAKRVLLHSTGLAHNLLFDRFLGVLSERRQNDAYIDRHFIPQSILHNSLAKRVDWEMVELKDVEAELGMFTQKKSSSELAYHSSGMKADMTESELSLLEGYLDVWR